MTKNNAHNTEYISDDHNMKMSLFTQCCDATRTWHLAALTTASPHFWPKKSESPKGECEHCKAHRVMGVQKLQYQLRLNSALSVCARLVVLSPGPGCLSSSCDNLPSCSSLVNFQRRTLDQTGELYMFSTQQLPLRTRSTDRVCSCVTHTHRCICTYIHMRTNKEMKN